MTFKKPGDLGFEGSLLEAAKNLDTVQVMPVVPDFTDRLREFERLKRLERDADDARAGLAHTMYDALAAQMKKFEDSLANDEEVGAALASFGTQVTISVRSIEYRNPHLMIFKGEAPDGKLVELVQHTSQVNLLLVRMKVTDRKPHRIGFIGEEATP